MAYGTNSLYAQTPMNSNFLGIWEPPDIVVTGNETTITIGRHMKFRPDLLSHELYGTPKLWWIFKMINPDKLHDPVWDFVEGLEILTPSQADLSIYI
tara:strand:+ start:728 stop:1018 length:291 start_codon:yes stop_codon:yes gene_type:complete